ncbi:hypothetical protein D3C78_1024660 [compost metagenome]
MRERERRIFAHLLRRQIEIIAFRCGRTCENVPVIIHDKNITAGLQVQIAKRGTHRIDFDKCANVRRIAQIIADRPV